MKTRPSIQPQTIPFRTTAMRRALIATTVALGFGFGAAMAASDNSSMPKARSDGVVATITDTATTTKVKSKLMAAKGLKKSDISVTTINGVVVLEGSASSAEAKSLAGDDAGAVEGVKSVENNLKIATSSGATTKARDAVATTERVATDSWITTKVKADIYADSMLKGFDVSVKTLHGVVMLKGALANQDAIEHVKDIAGRVKGVKSVDTSTLIVASK